MCQICKDAVDRLIAAGKSEDEAMDWLWNETPFPACAPKPTQAEGARENRAAKHAAIREQIRRRT